MKEYKIVKVEIWTYVVKAESKEEAELKCDDGDWIFGEQEVVKILSSEEIAQERKTVI